MPRRTGAARLGIAITIALTLLTERAWADATHACVTDSYETQRLRDEGKLIEARTRALECSREACPQVIVSECVRWLSEIEARLPTVVLAVRDEERIDLPRARIFLDGTPLVNELDGRPVAVNPGAHTFRFEHDGRVAARSVVVLEGEKNRILEVVLDSRGERGDARALSPTGRAAQRERAPLWPALLTGGIGIAGLGTFAFFGATGQVEKDRLAGGCALSRTCNPDDVDSARTKLLVADIALGVSIVARGAAAYFIVQRVSSGDR